MFVLTPVKNNNISYEADGYLFYFEITIVSKKTNFCETYKDILLPTITIGSSIVLNNIFFDFYKSNLRTTSKIDLKNMLSLLKKNLKVIYTD